MFFVYMNFFGVAWDIQWHNDVGPDSFWTLPHIFFYGGTAFAGLICLYVVLLTTAQYRKGVAGVSDETTTPWLGLFRAPMGFVITGLGSLTFLISGFQRRAAARVPDVVGLAGWALPGLRSDLVHFPGRRPAAPVHPAGCRGSGVGD